MTKSYLAPKRAGILPYLTLLAGIVVMLVANWIFVI